MRDATIDAAERQPAASGTRRRSGGGLNGMVLAELQQVAGGLGIKATGRMRKSQLIEAITAAQSSGNQSSGNQSSGDRNGVESGR
ncbi:MAG: Rho termination factor N-terminal domain-containing protein, partial [Actinomycetota bacterium]|nr:Rho termination factor N-terminal domain-containing protein [Actinomycetota bacterium]